jgi:RNA polymerase sigma-70 factor (ECF subfamily)
VHTNTIRHRQSRVAMSCEFAMTTPAYCPSDAYVQQLTTHQVHLQGYIFASLANHADAEDVLQRTNLTLLKKSADFPADGEFLPWAIAVAKYEILSFIRDFRRDRAVFNPTLVEMMCESASSEVPEVTERQEVLRSCLQQLPERSRRFLALRYASDKSIQQIAEQSGRSIDGVKAVLFRLRRKLEQCVERGMSRSQA